jgi:hypothetical protein
MRTFIKYLSLSAVIAASIIFVFESAYSADATFQWDRNRETDLAGYRLYQSSTSGQYTYGVGNEVGSVTVTDPASDDMGTHPNEMTIQGVGFGTWYWVLTAFDNEIPSLESGPSNEVTADITVPGPPGIPPNIRVGFFWLLEKLGIYTVHVYVDMKPSIPIIRRR